MPRGAPDSHVESSTTRCSAIFGALRHHGGGAPGRVNASWTEPSEPPRSRRARRPNAGGSPPGTRRACRWSCPCGTCRANRCRWTRPCRPPTSRSRPARCGESPGRRAGAGWRAGCRRSGHPGGRAAVRHGGRAPERDSPAQPPPPGRVPGERRRGCVCSRRTAANPAVLHGFEPTQLGAVLTAGDGPIYRFRSADLAVLDEQVWQLVLDVEVLSELMHEIQAARPAHIDWAWTRRRPGCRTLSVTWQRSPSSRKWPESAGSSPRTPAAWARPYG